MKLWFLLLSIVGVGLLGGDGQKWELRKQKADIKVYTRDGKNSNIKELMIETRMKGELGAILAALDDVPTHHEWVYKCESAKFIEKEDSDGYFYYVAMDFPFPAVDRDIVIFTEKEQDPVSKQVRTYSFASPDSYPEQEGYIRIREFSSSYEITPKGNGYLGVVFTMFTDPAGHIPSWMVNMAIARGPIKTMKALSVQVQQQKYKGKEIIGLK